MDLGFYVVGAVVAFFVLRGPIRQIRMGMHLAGMTTVFEEMEATRYTMPIGAGGGIDSLSRDRQRSASSVLENGITYLKAFPRHEVTRALVKNAQLAERLGRVTRLVAMQRLLDMLIELDVALGTDEFMQSYA